MGFDLTSNASSARKMGLRPVCRWTQPYRAGTVPGFLPADPKKPPIKVTLPAGTVFPATIPNPHSTTTPKETITIIVVNGEKYPEAAEHAQEAIDEGIGPGGVIDCPGA